jgi:hypothetical protein
MATTLVELRSITQDNGAYNDPAKTWLICRNGGADYGQIYVWERDQSPEYKSLGGIGSYNFGGSLYMYGTRRNGAQYFPTGTFTNLTNVKLRLLCDRSAYQNGNTPVSACDTIKLVAAPNLGEMRVFDYILSCTTILGSCNPPYETSYEAEHIVEIDLTGAGIDWNLPYGFGFRFDHEMSSTAPTLGWAHFSRWHKAYIVIEGDFVAGTIGTLPATDLNWLKGSATFNGYSGGMKQVYFKWGGEGLEHNSVKVPAAANFSVYLHGATRDWWYYFQAVGVDSSGAEHYGEVLSFMLTQTEAQPAYVTKLIIRGQPLVPLETMTLFAKDADSIVQYGKRTYSLSTQFSLSQDDTQVILNEILADNKGPRINNLIVTFQSLKPGALKDSVITADISTRITLINTLLGIYGDFFINNIKHTVTEAGLSYAVQWRLERAYETTPAP